MRPLLSFLLPLVLLGVATARAAPPDLVADLSSHQVNITTSFTGTRVLLFGATYGAGDVVVVVHGPKRREVVRRKERVAGIWVNRRSVAFEDVPGYYFEASTRPLNKIANEATLRRLRIGAIRLPVRVEEQDGETKANEYWQALLRLKRNQNLYVASPDPVEVVEDRLFRVDVTLPAGVPTGSYVAEIYLFRGGRPVNVERKQLSVRRAGVDAAIFSFAHQHSALYGILAILVALIAGWLAGVIFRKV